MLGALFVGESAARSVLSAGASCPSVKVLCGRYYRSVLYSSAKVLFGQCCRSVLYRSVKVPVDQYCRRCVLSCVDKSAVRLLLSDDRSVGWRVVRRQTRRWVGVIGRSVLYPLVKVPLGQYRRCVVSSVGRLPYSRYILLVGRWVIRRKQHCWFLIVGRQSFFAREMVGWGGGAGGKEERRTGRADEALLLRFVSSMARSVYALAVGPRAGRSALQCGQLIRLSVGERAVRSILSGTRCRIRR